MNIFTIRQFSFFLLFVLITTPAFSQTTATLKGFVYDQEQVSLPGANILLTDTQKGAASDINGAYRITGIQPGTYQLRVTYLGYNTINREVTLQSGLNTVNFTMEESTIGDLEVVVYGELTKGQARALNQQQNAPNITYVVSSEVFDQYPDVSAAETVQRFPAISITRDQGEGEFVQVRGLSEEFNSLTIDGLRIPSMEDDAGRGVGLDLVQTKLIETIKVTKTLKPDMDADALGGAVDFQLKKAGEVPELELQVLGGFNDQESVVEEYGEDIFGASGIAGGRFGDERFGLLVGGSYFNTDRGSLFNSWRYANDTGSLLRRHRTTDYDINRERYGFIGNFDFRASENSQFELLFNHNTYIDDEIRRQTRFLLEDNEEERRIRNRNEEQYLNMLKFTGKHLVNNITIDYSGSWALAIENLPDRTEARFERDVDYSGLSNDQIFGLLPDFVFPGNSTPLEFSRVEFDTRRTEEQNLTGSFDITIPTSLANGTEFKFGGKVIGKDRDFETAETRFNLASGQTLTNPADGSFAFVDVRFGDSEFNRLFENPTATEDPDEDPSTYDAEETVIAGYGMATVSLSEKWSTLAGLRIEDTNNDYTQIATGNTGDGGFTTALPSFHLNFEPSEGYLIRAAVTKGLARPNYRTLVPVDIRDDDDLEVSRGNTDLDPTITWNYDLIIERYSNFLGYFSAGAFYKSLIDPIATQSFNETINGQTFTVFQPQNGGSADLLGFEFSARQSLAVLGVPALRWFGLNGSYTYLYTESDFGSTQGENLPLPNSPDHIANGSITYDNSNIGLSAVLAGVYRGPVFSKFEGGDDIWLDDTFHMDFSLRFNFTNQFSAFWMLNNITNQPMTEVNGDPRNSGSRVHEREKYSWWTTAGISYQF